MTLGQKIKRLRRDKDLGQAQLAKKVGTTVVSISNYETDKTVPSSDMLFKLAKVFNVTVDYLVSGQSEAAMQIKNKELQKRVEQLDRISPERIKSLLDVMDVYIRENAKELLTA